jgi:hypothetical protein
MSTVKAKKEYTNVQYVLTLDEQSALELHEFLGEHMRDRDGSGNPRVEVRVRNALVSAGIKLSWQNSSGPSW